MARGGKRWGTKTLRERMPLPAERPAAPRFDGRYVGPRGSHVVAFFEDGAATIDAQAATWSLASGTLHLSSAGWDCEGSLGLDSLFLLASPRGNHHRRAEWELAFQRERVDPEPK